MQKRGPIISIFKPINLFLRSPKQGHGRSIARFLPTVDGMQHESTLFVVASLGFIFHLQNVNNAGRDTRSHDPSPSTREQSRQGCHGDGSRKGMSGWLLVVAKC